MRGVAGKPTIGMRIVVHLSRSSRFQEDYVCPRETTQDGIAEKLGIGRGHAASELRVLIKRKLVKFELKHIPGVGIRKRAYFLTPAGETRCYYATDNVVSPLYRRLTPEDLFEIADRRGLRYDPSALRGVTFGLVGALSECGKLGMLAIDTGHEAARRRFRSAVAVLDEEAVAG